jgi:D-lactate dehydrogenase
MKTLVFSAHPYEVPFLEEAASGKHELIFVEDKLTSSTAAFAQGCKAIAIFTADEASAGVLQKLSAYGVSFIALRSAGYDHIDLSRAAKLGIRAANVPAYSPYSIAEHAVALVLALNRRIVEGQMLIRMNDFRLDTLVGFDIHGKTVGLIGAGTIGCCFANIMRGFGAKVIGYDPHPTQQARDAGISFVTLNELLTQSDIISLHCPLNESTKQLISKEVIYKMKEGVILINTARGGIVNTADLLDAIDSGKVAGACLDVYEREKQLFFEDQRQTLRQDPLFSRLLSNRNVIVSGHQAFLTKDALKGIAQTTIANLDHWEDGEDSPNELFKIARPSVAQQLNHRSLMMDL